MSRPPLGAPIDRYLAELRQLRDENPPSAISPDHFDQAPRLVAWGVDEAKDLGVLYAASQILGPGRAVGIPLGLYGPVAEQLLGALDFAAARRAQPAELRQRRQEADRVDLDLSGPPFQVVSIGYGSDPRFAETLVRFLHMAAPGRSPEPDVAETDFLVDAADAARIRRVVESAAFGRWARFAIERPGDERG